MIYSRMKAEVQRASAVPINFYAMLFYGLEKDRCKLCWSA